MCPLLSRPVQSRDGSIPQNHVPTRPEKSVPRKALRKLSPTFQRMCEDGAPRAGIAETARGVVDSLSRLHFVGGTTTMRKSKPNSRESNARRTIVPNAIRTTCVERLRGETHENTKLIMAKSHPLPLRAARALPGP